MSKKRWTEIEDDFVKKEYPLGALSTRQIGEILGRTRYAVSSRALKLGLIYGSANEIKEGYKRCSRCRGVYPLELFSHNRQQKDNRDTYCKSCASARSKDMSERFEASREDIIEKQCYHCKNIKPVSEFWKYKYSMDGYLGDCKVCAKLKRAIRDANKINNKKE